MNLLQFSSSRNAKKLNCKEGNYQCGGKCQNNKFNCPSQMSPEDKRAYEKAKRAARETKKIQPQNERKLPIGVSLETRKNDEGEYRRKYSFSVENTKLDFVVTKTGENSASIDFTVGGGFDKGLLEGRSATSAAIKLLKITQYEASTRPDGFQYIVIAYAGDGFEERRRSIYERAGFDNDPYSAFQSSTVRKGKLSPN